MQTEITGSPNNMEMTRLVGGFIAVSSFGMGLIFMFAVPIACTFVGSLGLVMLTLLFIAGLCVFLVGQVKIWRKRRENPGLK